MILKLLRYIAMLFRPTFHDLHERERKRWNAPDGADWVLVGKPSSGAVPSSSKPFAVLRFTGRPVRENLGWGDVLNFGISYKNLEAVGWGKKRGDYYDVFMVGLDGKLIDETVTALGENYVFFPIPLFGTERIDQHASKKK